MNNIQERIQRAVESILENEALTADLDDAAAQILLDWGVNRARAIASETTEMNEAQAEEFMYPPMRALRKMLRNINKWAVNPQESTLAGITEQAEIVYGSSPDEAHITAFLTQIPNDPTERVSVLRAFIEVERRDPYEA